jgi:hypothetical protein
MQELIKQDEKHRAEARTIMEEPELEMSEWDTLIEEEELGVQVSQIFNEGDDLETLMFGCIGRMRLVSEEARNKGNCYGSLTFSYQRHSIWW